MLESRSTSIEHEYQTKVEEHIATAVQIYGHRLVCDAFPKYASRQSITRFLARDEIFRRIRTVHGSILELGAYTGVGVMTWAQLSSIYEPITGMNREVFGFDTFTGFPGIHQRDVAPSFESQPEVGYLSVSGGVEELSHCVKLFDMNRSLNQFAKVHLIVGDFANSVDEFFRDHPHVVPALLYLDFDLYEPTRIALEKLMPMMPKGSLIAFDELGDPRWPGESRAFYDVVDPTKARLERSTVDPKICWFEVGS